MSRYKINKTFEVARVGTWNGNDVTLDMLKEVEINNKSAKSPIIRGHVNYPAGSEAEGYISNPELKGDRLRFKAVLYDDLARDYESGKFINHSVEIKPYTSVGAFVPALALLGAEAPAMKGLQVYSEEKNEETVLHFNNNIKNEVIMDFEKEIALVKSELQKGFDDKLDKIKLEFAESGNDKDKIISDLQAKVAKLEDEKAEQKKIMFSELANEKVKDILKEEDRKAKKEKLMKFSEKCDTVEEYKEYLSEINFKSTKAIIPETKLEFSEGNESEVNEYNSKAY